MSTQVISKAINMPDGVKALKIFSSKCSSTWAPYGNFEFGDDSFWVLGDDGFFYVYNLAKDGFEKADRLWYLNTYFFSDGWNLAYINHEGRLNVFYRGGLKLDKYLKAINLEFDRLNLRGEDVTGAYLSLSMHIAVADNKIFVANDDIFNLVKEMLEEDSDNNYGRASKVRLVDGEPGVIVADIPTPSEEIPKKPIVFRVSSSVFMISVDGGYTFLPFGRHPQLFFGNKVIFDNPVEFWGEGERVYGGAVLINSLGEARLIEERDVVNTEGLSEDVNLRDVPIIATNALYHHRGFSLTFLLTGNGDIFAKSCIGDKRGMRIVLPGEIESIECVHNPGKSYYSGKKGMYDPSFAAILKGGSTVGFIKFNIQT